MALQQRRFLGTRGLPVNGICRCSSFIISVQQAAPFARDHRFQIALHLNVRVNFHRIRWAGQSALGIRPIAGEHSHPAVCAGSVDTTRQRAALAAIRARDAETVACHPPFTAHQIQAAPVNRLKHDEPLMSASSGKVER